MSLVLNRLVCCAFGQLFLVLLPISLKAVGPFELNVVPVRGIDTLFLELYVRSTGSPGSYFELGSSNFVIGVETFPQADQINLAGVVIRPADVALSAFQPPDYFTPPTVAVNLAQKFINVQVVQSPSGLPGQGVTVNNITKLIARVALPYNTSLTPCDDSLNLYWRPLLGAMTEYATVLSVKPWAQFNNPPDLALGAVIAQFPTSACPLTDSLLFVGNGLGNWAISSTMALPSQLLPPVFSTDSVYYSTGSDNFLSSDLVTFQLGTCLTSRSVTVFPRPDIVATSPVCSGDGPLTFTLSNVLPGAWFLRTPVLSSGTDLGGGSYEYTAGIAPFALNDTLFFTSSTGCQDTAAITVQPLPAPNILGPNTALVGQANISYHVLIEPNTLYSWQVLGNATLASTSLSPFDSIRVNFNNQGQDTIVVTGFNTLTGCSKDDTLFVNVGGCPPAGISGPDSVCNGEPLVVYTHPYSDAVWTVLSSIGSDTSSTTSGTPDTAFVNFGSFPAYPPYNVEEDTLIVQYNFGACFDSLFVTVLQEPSILFDTPPKDTTLCIGSRIPFESTYNINWRVEEGAVITPLSSRVDSIQYTFNQTGANLLIGSFRSCSDTIIVTVLTPPAISINGPTTVAYPPPGPVIFDAALIGGVSYIWNNSNQCIGTAGAGPVNQFNVLFDAVGCSPPTQDSIFLEYQDALCSYFDTLEVAVVNCTATAGTPSADTAICSGTQAVLTSTGFTPGSSFRWESTPDTMMVPFGPQGGPFEFSQVLITNNLTATEYYRLIINDGLCEDTTSIIEVVVDQLPNPGVLSGTDTICENSSTFITLGGFTANDIIWQQSADNITFTDFTPPTVVPNLAVSPPVGRTYYRAKVRTACDSTVSNVVTITVSDSARGDFLNTPAPICANGQTTPLGSSTLTGVGHWATSGSGGFIGATNPNGRYVSDSADGGTTVTLTWVVESPACPNDSNPQPLVVHALSKGSFPNLVPDICFTDPTVPLGASIVTGTTARWEAVYFGTTVPAAGSFVPGINDPNAVYQSVVADAGDTIELRWITENFFCIPDTQAQTVFVGETPIGSFTQNLGQICVGTLSPVLNASITAGFGNWSTDGLGTLTVFDDSTAQYQSVGGDAGDTVRISFVVSSGSCLPLVFNQPLIVNDFSSGSFTNFIDTICSGGNTEPLNAVAINGVGVYSTPNGSGTFLPSATNPSARYQSVFADGSQDIILNWTVTNGACPPVTYPNSVFVRPDQVDGTFSTIVPDVCVNDSTVPLGATVAAGTGQWFASPGGSFFPSTTDPNAVYVSDASVQGQTVTLTWQITNGTCAPLTIDQDIFVYPAPQGLLLPASAPPVCVNDISVTFAGFITVGDSGRFFHNGSGVFTNPGSSVTAYDPAPADAGDTIQICWVVYSGPCDSFRICRDLIVGPIPAGNFAANPPAVCAGSPTIPLNSAPSFASVTAGTGTWSTSNGAGTFSLPNNPASTYISAPADAGQFINLTWTISSPGCPSISFTRQVFVNNTIISGIFPGPLANVCVNGITPQLNASVGPGTTHTWLSRIKGTVTPGAGVFVNAANPTLTQYDPAPADAGDTLELIFRITDLGGLCNSTDIVQQLVVNDFGVANILSQPQDTTCFLDPTDTLRASAPYGIPRWESGGAPGSFFSNPTSLNTVYYPGPGDAGGFADVYFIADAGACPSDTDTVRIRVFLPPNGSFFQALPDICAGSQTPTLLATVTTGTGRWASTGFGRFTPDSLTAQAQYVADTNDAGTTVQLQWIVENGTCPPDTNRQNVNVLNILLQGEWDSLPEPIICCGDSTSPLGGVVNLGTGQWETDGFGFFFPNPSDPNAVYVPQGIDCGDPDSVEVTWRIDDVFSVCASRRISHKLFVNPPGAGAILNSVPQICVNDVSDTLFALATYGTGFWSCPNCNGFFTDTNNVFTAYQSAQADTTSDPLQITWNVVSTACPPTQYVRTLVVNDSSMGMFPPLADDSICAGTASLPFGASVQYGVGSWACQNCDGGFKNPTSFNAQYISTQLDGDQLVEIDWIVQNGVCPPDTNSRFLWVDTIPEGSFNQVLPPTCEAGALVGPLNATVLNGTGFWTASGGNGSFVDPLDPNTFYTTGTISTPGLIDTVIFLQWNVVNGDCDTVTYDRSLRILRRPIPSLSFTLASVCAGAPFGMTGFILGSGNNITGRFLDNTGNGVFTTQSGPTGTSTFYTPSALDAGDTVDIIWRTSSNECAFDSVDAVAQIVVRGGSFIAQILEPTALPTFTICLGDTILFTGTGGQGYQWQAPSGTTFITGDPLRPYSSVFNDSVDIRVSIPGAYILFGIDTVANCQTSDTLFITVSPGGVISINSTQPTLCQGDSTLLTVTGGDGNLYLWDPVDSLTAPFAPTTWAKPSTTTVYTVRASTPPDGCFSEATTTVDVIPFPPLLLDGGDACEGDSAYLVLGNPGDCDLFSWYQGDKITVSGGGGTFVTTNDSLLLSNYGQGNYTFTLECVNTTFGCNKYEDIDLRVVPYPDANFTATPLVAPFSNPLVNFFDASTGGVNRWVWFFDDTLAGADNVANEQNPSHLFRAPGQYTIALFVENDIGCSDLEIKSSYVEIEEEDYFFPSGFTPNGDGRNDFFRPLPVGIARMRELQIFDRWGKVVYETDDVVNGWPGFTNEGKPFDPGTYLFRCIIDLDVRGDTEYRGYITLVR